MRGRHRPERKEWAEKNWHEKLGDILLIGVFLSLFVAVPFYEAARTWVSGDPLMAVLGLVPYFLAFGLVIAAMSVIR